MADAKVNTRNGEAAPGSASPLGCGLIMPISTIDGCPAEHWSEVKAIVTEGVEAITDPKFIVKLVSEADDVGVIQKRIVQNIYNSDVVVCDVSGKNPNVMFELGMRLAFDKRTVIIKDDRTEYSFDTAIIEHVGYPRDLRFPKMVTFKALLADKVAATYRASKASADQSTFLKNFGKFHIANLSQDVVPPDKLAVELMTEIQDELSRLRRTLPAALERSSSSLDRRGRGVSAIYQALAEYMLENPGADLRTLVSRKTFTHDIERRCDAPRHFVDPEDFAHALETAIRNLLPFKEPRRATKSVRVEETP